MKLFFGFVKQIICRWGSDFRFCDFFWHGNDIVPETIVSVKSYTVGLSCCVISCNTLKKWAKYPQLDLTTYESRMVLLSRECWAHLNRSVTLSKVLKKWKACRIEGELSLNWVNVWPTSI